MIDYPLTTAEVRKAFTQCYAWPRPPVTGEWFDQWLRLTRAEVLRETAKTIHTMDDPTGYIRGVLNTRADRIEKGEI